MTHTVGLAAAAIVAPIVSATALARRHRISQDPIRRLLATLIIFMAIELLPVQMLAACQIIGVLKLVNVFSIAVLQVVILTVIVIGVRLFPHSQPVGSKGDRVASRIRRLPRPLIVSGVMVLVSHLVSAINLLTSYPTGWDGLAYHLPLSLRWLQDGAMNIPASRVWPFSMPGNTEIGMMLLLATVWQALVPLFNWLSLIVLALAIYLIARKCSGDVIAALMAVLILLTIPLFQFQAYSAYVDLAGTAYLMAAVALFLYRYEDHPDNDSRVALSWPIVTISGIACGISIGTKAVFYVYASVFLLTVLMVLMREGKYHRRSLIFAVLVMGLSAAGPSAFWFWRAFHATGNPIYPLQVSFDGHTIFRGYRSNAITPNDMVRTSSPLGWLLYPWMEQMINQGGASLSYGLDSGFGGAFATFVPVGLAFCLYLCLKRAANGNTVILLVVWVFMLGVWWFALRHYPRFGLPLWAVSCALTSPLLGRFHRSDSKIFHWLLACSVMATCGISAFGPLHEMLARFRTGNWARSAYYGYPAFIDQLPEGSRVLNKATKFNFVLAGKRLTTQVIPDFESPSNVTDEYLVDERLDYVIESSEGEDHFLDLRTGGGELVYDDWLPLGEGGERREWRVWRIGPRPGRP